MSTIKKETGGTWGIVRNGGGHCKVRQGDGRLESRIKAQDYAQDMGELTGNKVFLTSAGRPAMTAMELESRSNQSFIKYYAASNGFLYRVDTADIIDNVVEMEDALLIGIHHVAKFVFEEYHIQYDYRSVRPDLLDARGHWGVIQYEDGSWGTAWGEGDMIHEPGAFALARRLNEYKEKRYTLRHEDGTLEELTPYEEIAGQGRPLAYDSSGTLYRMNDYGDYGDIIDIIDVTRVGTVNIKDEKAWTVERDDFNTPGFFKPVPIMEANLDDISVLDVSLTWSEAESLSVSLLRETRVMLDIDGRRKTLVELWTRGEAVYVMAIPRGKDENPAFYVMGADRFYNVDREIEAWEVKQV